MKNNNIPSAYMTSAGLRINPCEMIRIDNSDPVECKILAVRDTLNEPVVVLFKAEGPHGGLYGTANLIPSIVYKDWHCDKVNALPGDVTITALLTYVIKHGFANVDGSRINNVHLLQPRITISHSSDGPEEI